MKNVQRSLYNRFIELNCYTTFKNSAQYNLFASSANLQLGKNEGQQLTELNHTGFLTLQGNKEVSVSQRSDAQKQKCQLTPHSVPSHRTS